MRLPDWLVSESEAWQRDGLITDDQRRQILARYAAVPSAADRAASALTWLAVLVAGAGAIVLVAWNWTSIPAPIKVLMSSGPMVGLFALAVQSIRRGQPVRAERLALLAAVFAGCVLFLTEDFLHIDPQRTNTALLFAAILGTTALLVPSALVAAVGAAVSVWWVVNAGDAGTDIWWFVAVWLMLALASERAPNRWVAGGLTVAFAVWVFFTLVTIWPDHAVVPGLGVLIAASWIDALAHSRPGRRPAFARSTPALALTLLALILLLPLATHQSMPDWQLATGSPLTGAALLGALIASVAWIARGSGLTRPLALTALAAACLLAWILLPEAWRSTTWLPWFWTFVFSIAAVLTGASVVREAARSRDLAQFAIGLLMVIAFVIVRVIDAGSLVVSGVILLVSAAGLWWLARFWIQGRSSTPGVELPSGSGVRLPESNSAVLSARGVAVAACLAIVITSAHAAYRWWPVWRGTEILMSAALFRQPAGLNLVLVQLPLTRIEIDVPHDGPAVNEAFVSAKRAGDWWPSSDKPRARARLLRGRRLYVQLTPGLVSLSGGPSEMQADTVSDVPVSGAMNLGGRVVRASDDGYLWLDYSVGWIAVPPDVVAHARPLAVDSPPRDGVRAVPAATDPGVYAVLRLLPSGRVALTGVIVNGTRYR